MRHDCCVPDARRAPAVATRHSRGASGRDQRQHLELTRDIARRFNLKNELADFGSDDAVALIERWWLHAVMRLCGVTSEIRMPDDLSPPSPCVLDLRAARRLRRRPPHLQYRPSPDEERFPRLQGAGRRRVGAVLHAGNSRAPPAAGAREATQETLDRALRSGRSVGLSTGGVWEQLHTSHEQEALSLLPNLGFVRLAMRHGVPLVPTSPLARTRCTKRTTLA